MATFHGKASIPIRGNKDSTSEECPTCGEKIVFKEIGEELRSFNLDGTIHHCRPTSGPKPIGQALIGHTIERITLRNLTFTLFLSDGFMLEVSSFLNDERVSLNLALVTPDGIIEEKGRPLSRVFEEKK